MFVRGVGACKRQAEEGRSLRSENKELFLREILEMLVKREREPARKNNNLFLLLGRDIFLIMGLGIFIYKKDSKLVGEINSEDVNGFL